MKMKPVKPYTFVKKHIPLSKTHQSLQWMTISTSVKLTYLLREQAAESTETVTDELLALFGMSRGKQDDFTNLSDNEEELPNVSVSQYLYEDE